MRTLSNKLSASAGIMPSGTRYGRGLAVDPHHRGGWPTLPVLTDDDQEK